MLQPLRHTHARSGVRIDSDPKLRKGGSVVCTFTPSVLTRCRGGVSEHHYDTPGLLKGSLRDGRED